MNPARSVAQAFDLLVHNHAKLSGSHEERLDIACETVLASFEHDPNSILGPICEQITRTQKKSRRLPYLNVAQWIHERSTASFDEFIRSAIAEFAASSGEPKRRMMGCCILIRSLALSSVAPSRLAAICASVDSFTSVGASVFEMDVFNTALFTCSVCGYCGRDLVTCVDRFSIWMKSAHPIVSTAAAELSSYLQTPEKNDQEVIPLIPLMRTDIPPSSEKCQSVWSKLAAEPFASGVRWIELGLAIGRCDPDRLRGEIASLSSDRGQFASIITVSLSVVNRTIQRIGRALFRFGIHGKETAAFDPSSLSQILEQTDTLTTIAITFLSEMALANANECVPQLFPLLQSDKPAARKNSLKLLSRILSGELDDSVRQIIATNLLPMISDESISVRVDIPKLFVSVPPGFIVPHLMRLLGDRDEKKRSTASASLKRILKETSDPANLLKTVLDFALGMASAPSSPADIHVASRDEMEVARDRALKLIEQWATDSQGTMMLDPVPVLSRLWADPRNGTIVSFIAKATPLYDTNRLLAALLTQLRKPAEELFDRLAPLLVLRSQPHSFFAQREVVASPLFDLIFVPDDQIREIRRVRAEIVASFPLSFIVPRVVEFGLLNKFALSIVCMAGMFNGQPIPEVAEILEQNMPGTEDELFLPVCDAFFFADMIRCLTFAIDNCTNHRGVMLLHISFKKFTPDRSAKFVKSGLFDRLMRIRFPEPDEALAVESIFFFVFQSKTFDLDDQWEQLFELGSHFSDSRKAECRFAGLKLIAALLTNSAAQAHLIGNLERIQHMLALASDDWAHPDTQRLGRALSNMMQPSAEQMQSDFDWEV
jgi:hypothetical protein